MSGRGDLIAPDERGLRCAAGGFHVDPWRPVELALVTHAHADHARPGSRRYVCAEACAPLLRRRLGADARIETLSWGEARTLGEVEVSFHPAGHVFGSAQLRVEDTRERWVVSGDYKRADDPASEPFELVPADVFVTEATFALPIYRWPPAEEVAAEILAWWGRNREAGRASVLFCYALGKAQRLLAELGRLGAGRVLLHGALVGLVEAYREAGVAMAPSEALDPNARGVSYAGELVLAPPSVRRSPYMRRFGEHETAFASGFMSVRGTRRRRGVDRGFVISDHADWPDLLRTIEETGARRVLTTHGYADALARFLREERGLDAAPLETRYAGEEADEAAGPGITSPGEEGAP